MSGGVAHAIPTSGYCESAELALNVLDAPADLPAQLDELGGRPG